MNLLLLLIFLLFIVLRKHELYILQFHLCIFLICFLYFLHLFFSFLLFSPFFPFFYFTDLIYFPLFISLILFIRFFILFIIILFSHFSLPCQHEWALRLFRSYYWTIIVHLNYLLYLFYLFSFAYFIHSFYFRLFNLFSLFFYERGLSQFWFWFLRSQCSLYLPSLTYLIPLPLSIFLTYFTYSFISIYFPRIFQPFL